MKPYALDAALAAASLRMILALNLSASRTAGIPARIMKTAWACRLL